MSALVVIRLALRKETVGHLPCLRVQEGWRFLPCLIRTAALRMPPRESQRAASSAELQKVSLPLSFFKSVTQVLEGTKCTSVIFCSNNSPLGIINFSSGPEQISVTFNGTLFLARTVTSLDLLFKLYEKPE